MMFKRFIEWLKRTCKDTTEEDDDELLLQFLLFDDLDGD